MGLGMAAMVMGMKLMGMDGMGKMRVISAYL